MEIEGTGREISILLVEDSPTDVRLTREALKEGKIHNVMHVVSDGIQAMDFLNQRASYQGAARPDLILLDLNLPGKDGREVLSELKADPDLRRIPVIILTTSEDEEDIVATYQLHANCYITKPVDFDHFINVIQQIRNFWLTVVQLPTS